MGSDEHPASAGRQFPDYKLGCQILPPIDNCNRVNCYAARRVGSQFQRS